MQRRGCSTVVRRTSPAIGAALAMAVMLGGCAKIDPVAGWKPAAWPETTGVQLVHGDGAEVMPDADTDLNALGLIEHRIRNDTLQLSMRYVELPGMHTFNARVAEIVSAAVASTGRSYSPEVFPVAAGLNDRGCVAGSATWPAEEVLSDPRTGPAAGNGTAVTCEVVAAYGMIVGVALRTVTGDSDEVTGDSRQTLYADVTSGSVVEGSSLWSADAASGLWTQTVELLRRQSGALSAAPLGEPSADQLALAARAFDVVRAAPDGGAVLSVPAGLASPELAGLGIEQTVEATEVQVDADTLAAWQSEAAAGLQQQLDQPFVGLPEWDARQPVDCTLQACVAVTYDDGPSDFTEQLLDTLQAERTPATFFMLGRAASGRPEMVRRAASEGHEIASHTMTHPDLTKLKPDQMRREVDRAATILSDMTGQQITMYRPPYGAVNQKVLDAVNRPAILWSIDTVDWEDPGTEALVERSVGAATPGDIILFHDTHSATVDAAAVVLRGLKDRGFTPVTVSQLFGGSVPDGRVLRR